MAKLCTSVDSAGLYQPFFLQSSRASVASNQRVIALFKDGHLYQIAHRKTDFQSPWTRRFRTEGQAKHGNLRPRARLTFGAGARATWFSPKSTTLNPAGVGVQDPLLGPVSNHSTSKVTESDGQHKKGLATVSSVGCGSFIAYMLFVAPAQAAKYVPPPLGTNDPVPITDDLTVQDLGGLAILGIILLLVFLIGNFLLPSLMFSDGDPTVPFKRDEEGDFYHDPSFTKDFFREARKAEEDIDDLSWSQAPFSKLAHEVSKIFPPPKSVAAPEINKRRSKRVPSVQGPVGAGVRLSGIVAVPGSKPQSPAGSSQAASTQYASASRSVSAQKESGNVTEVESSSSAEGYTSVVKKRGLEQPLRAHLEGRKVYQRSKSRRSHKRRTGFW